MKDIKTRMVVKDIKRLNRLPNLLERVRYSTPLTRQQNDKEKAFPQSPNEYAQHHSASAIDKMLRAPIEMSVVASKRWIRRVQKKRTMSEDNTAEGRNPDASMTNPSGTRQTRLALRLYLRKPEDGKYRLSPHHPSSKQRFMRGWINARFLHPSLRDRFPDRMINREDRYREPAGKRREFSAAASHLANVRGDRPKALTSENLRKRRSGHPSSRVRSAISKQAGHTIKDKERKLKTLRLKF